MQIRAILFILAGTLASVTGVAYAAATGGAPGGETSATVIIIAVCAGLSQLGAVGLMIRVYTARVDAIGEAVKEIPVLVEILEAHKEAMKEHSANEAKILDEHAKHVAELFNSRNELKSAVDKINYLHDLKKCEESILRGACS